MPAHWISIDDKNILIADFSNIKLEKELVEDFNKTADEIRKLPTGAEVRILIDLSGSFATPGFMNAAKKLEKEHMHRLNPKRALVGIHGAKVILLKSFNLFSKNKLEAFSTREEALRYLSK